MEQQQQKQETQERIKKGRKKGQVTQRMMTFRLDNENAAWIAGQINKGRYINELIAKDRTSN